MVLMLKKIMHRLKKCGNKKKNYRYTLPQYILTDQLDH